MTGRAVTLATFPFPFRTDTFRYQVNVEAARQPVATPVGEWGRYLFSADDDYVADLGLRRRILASDPSRAVTLPHLRPAAWEAALFVLTELAKTDPTSFTLTESPDGWHWDNRLLASQHRFRFAEDDTLPCPPLEFAARQTQDDLVLLDQRDEQLFADAGVVTFAADWSFGFNVGMSFDALHAPAAPPVHASGVVPRAQQLLLQLEPGADLRRTNWSLTLGRYLDMSTEARPAWQDKRQRLLTALAESSTALPDGELSGTALPAGELSGTALAAAVWLRTELQHLIRLPLTGAILFTIRTYHCSIAELATVAEWRRRLIAVLTELPTDILAAKSGTELRAPLLAWLNHPADGLAATSPSQSRMQAVAELSARLGGQPAQRQDIPFDAEPDDDTGHHR